MTELQLDKLKALRDNLFEAMLLDTDPANWLGCGKTANQLTKQEREEVTWSRRQASSSILLWEKIDKLIQQYSQSATNQITLAELDIDSFTQEANELLTALQAKEQDEN